MVSLAWYDSYKTGLNDIDNDHKRLLELMRNIKRSINEHDLSSCAGLLNELIEEAKAHFRREEAYLRLYEYPDLDEHITYHTNLIIKAEALKRMSEGKGQGIELADYFNDMAEFLIDDVLHGDVHFIPFLEAKGLI